MKHVNAYHEGFDFMNFFLCRYFVLSNLFYENTAPTLRRQVIL